MHAFVIARLTTTVHLPPVRECIFFRSQESKWKLLVADCTTLVHPGAMNITRLDAHITIHGTAPTRSGDEWPYEQLLRNVTAKLLNESCIQSADLCQGVAVPLDEVKAHLF